MDIEKLDDLTKKVLSLVDIAIFKNGPDFDVEYQTKSGTCRCRSIFNIGTVAILYAKMSENSELIEHIHDNVVETLICVNGEADLVIEGKTITLKAGENLTIQPKTPHLAKSLAGCEIIGITIPASPGYPKCRDVQM